MNDIKIVDSVPEDVFGIRNVQKITWIDTYPNLDLGITKEDVEAKFSEDNTEVGKKKIEKWKEEYANPNQHRWVAKEGQEIIGFCVAGKGNNSNRIYAIYVIPSFQGKGLGKQLMEKALDWLSDNKDIYVNLAPYNTKALQFYEKFGFTKTGKNVHSEGVDALPSGKTIPEIEMIKKNQ